MGPPPPIRLLILLLYSNSLRHADDNALLPSIDLHYYLILCVDATNINFQNALCVCVPLNLLHLCLCAHEILRRAYAARVR